MHPSPTQPTPHSDQDVIFALPTESFECPDCGRTVVPTGDHLPDLRLEHRCPSPRQQTPGPSPSTDV